MKLYGDWFTPPVHKLSILFLDEVLISQNRKQLTSHCLIVPVSIVGDSAGNVISSCGGNIRALVTDSDRDATFLADEDVALVRRRRRAADDNKARWPSERRVHNIPRRSILLHIYMWLAVLFIRTYS